VALLERNQKLFRSDLQSSMDWLNRYFDARSKQVVSTGETLKQLASSGISIEMPDIAESLAAVRGFKAVPDKRAR
jgi:uncharacterized protein HemX